MIDALDIHVKGIVQGVGFRPFVYRLAKRYLINGWVMNASDGVHIRAEGESDLVDQFVLAISNDAPPAARVKEIDIKEVPIEPFDSFEIRFSDEDRVEEVTLVSPDMAVCEACTKELFDEDDRRYRYPFINCTDCGPRFTIIDGLPYDRPKTSMDEFKMCDACAAEYSDPSDRRFHAQPDACFDCGPHLWLHVGGTLRAADGREGSDAILAEAVSMLLDGKILAIKGLGGYHLACDASNADAVARLRERKHRNGKPFAVMMGTLQDVRYVCNVSDEEAAVLGGSVRPIVLLRKRGFGINGQEISEPDASQAEGTIDGEGASWESTLIADGVADGLPDLGVMLPYTPVQHLLMHDLADAVGASRIPVLVMTSGNIHDEPIVIDDAEAIRKLGGIADGILGNDRRIVARFDDSVVRVIQAGNAGPAIQMFRRARGYSPAPLEVKLSGLRKDGDGQCLGTAGTGTGQFQPIPVVFAAGPEQKNTFAFLRANPEGKSPRSDTEGKEAIDGIKLEAFVSQHIGDMENADAFEAWLETKKRYQELFDLAADALACDMHPEYITTKWAHEHAALHRGTALPLTEVQHHHAHVVSVIAENRIDHPVCGIAFDGTGYGADGNIWGGEALISNDRDFERFANFAYVPMPGGASCVRHPLQMAYGVLWAFDLLDHPAAEDALEPLGDAMIGNLETMIDEGINTPVTSSVGRLFDAASALLGICTEPTYEGEPAILLEAELWRGWQENAPEVENYRIDIVKNVATETSTARDTSVILLDAAPLFKAMLDDMSAGTDVWLISKKFHGAFVDAIVHIAQASLALYEIGTVTLSGGVFMNRYIVEKALGALERAGFTAAINRELPPNDGCVSYGEAVVALSRTLQSGD